jgi:hypothetical protein
MQKKTHICSPNITETFKIRIIVIIIITTTTTTTTTTIINIDYHILYFLKHFVFFFSFSSIRASSEIGLCAAKFARKLNYYVACLIIFINLFFFQCLNLCCFVQYEITSFFLHCAVSVIGLAAVGTAHK